MENKLNSKGNKEGLWIFKGPTGKKLREANYKNGIKDGQEILYFNNNNRKESIANYKNGKLNGPYVSFHNKSGSQIEEKGEYKNGKRHGYWIFSDIFYNKEGTYVNGKKHGHWIESTAVRNIKGFYCNDKKEGAWLSIRYPLDLPNRAPIDRIEYYKDGKLDFVSINFYENGKVYNFKEYQEGKRHGKFYTYLQDGKIYEGGNYQNDIKEGEWIEESDAGSFVKRNYKNGKQIR
jgi:antitoxin component YwqK of YwqJK toxin-antitoxin module